MSLNICAALANSSSSKPCIGPYSIFDNLISVLPPDWDILSDSLIVEISTPVSSTWFDSAE